MTNFILVRIGALILVFVIWVVAIYGGVSMMEHEWFEALARFALAGFVYRAATYVARLGDAMRDRLLEES